MIAFLLRLLIAFVVFSLLLWVVRVVGTVFRRHQIRRTSSRRPLREDPPQHKRKKVAVPPEDVIDVPYKDVS